MNKVEKVSIGGYAFSLEEDAYKTLSEYLEAMSRQYTGSEDGDEIMEAFEDRIAELLLEKSGNCDTVSLEAVKSIEEILGAPEAIGEATGAGNRSDMKTELKKDKRHFFRSRQDKLLGGVCGGLAAYYNMDVFLMRLIWVAAFILGAVAGESDFDWLEWMECLIPVTTAAYLLLWIRTPFADGRQERMIETRRFSSGENVGAAGKTLGNVLRISIGVILSMIGLAGIVTGVFLLIGWYMGGAGILPADIVEEMSTTFNGILFKMPSALLVILISLVYFVPFMLFLYEGIKIIFNFNSPSWHPGIIAILVWFVVVLVLAVLTGLSFIPSFNF